MEDAAATVELTLGHSPDADDAFMWWPLGTRGLVGGPADAPEMDAAIGTGRYRFRPVAADIQELNERAVSVGDLDITAISMHALARVRDRYALTDCGASFGEGYGPKVLVGGGSDLRDLGDLQRALDGGARVAVPGLETTAALVLRLMLGETAERAVAEGRLVPMRFDRVVPAALAGEAEAALVIHEAQVTYAEQGLRLLVDLGEWWAGDTGGLPLPLGGNAVRRDMDERFGAGTLAEVSSLLRASIDHALAERERSLLYASAFAPEELAAVRGAGDAAGGVHPLLERFVGLYVTDLTVSMGEVGRRAVSELFGRAAAAGLIEGGDDPVVIG